MLIKINKIKIFILDKLKNKENRNVALVMSVLCRVCLVFPPHVSIFGLFPVLVRCNY